jgi:serine/threonine protein kinase
MATAVAAKAEHDVVDVTDSEDESPGPVADPCTYHNLKEFSIGKPLGRGRFGRVFMAIHNKSEILVALKFLSKNELVKSRMEQQVVREIEIHNQLNHPNIVEFLGYFTDPRRIYLIFEYCLHGELYKFVQKQPNRVLDVERTATYIFQAADALVYAHSKGVMHRDIKPENMLLGVYQEVKLSDFGWGIHDGRGKRKTICGTLDYLPPEMVQRTEYDNKV